MDLDIYLVSIFIRDCSNHPERAIVTELHLGAFWKLALQEGVVVLFCEVGGLLSETDVVENWL